MEYELDDYLDDVEDGDEWDYNEDVDDFLDKYDEDQLDWEDNQ